MNSLTSKFSQTKSVGLPIAGALGGGIGFTCANNFARYSDGEFENLPQRRGTKSPIRSPRYHRSQTCSVTGLKWLTAVGGRHLRTAAIRTVRIVKLVGRLTNVWFAPFGLSCAPSIHQRERNTK